MVFFSNEISTRMSNYIRTHIQRHLLVPRGMVSKNMLPYLTAMVTILDNESHPYRQQCNLRIVMMCENNRVESQQIQIGENKTCQNKVA